MHHLSGLLCTQALELNLWQTTAEFRSEDTVAVGAQLVRKQREQNGLPHLQSSCEELIKGRLLVLSLVSFAKQG